MGKPAGGGLTAKEALFVREWLVDMNAAQALIRAGYSAKSARQHAHLVMKRPHVKAALDAAMAQRAEKVELSAEWVLRHLMDNVRDARMARDFTAANRALELLGKHLALFPDKVNIDVRDIAAMTDEQLEAEARTLRLVA